MYQGKISQQYKISIDYDDYFASSSQINASNLQIIGDSIMFTTNKETLNLLDNKNIRYMLHESKKDNFKGFFKHKSGILIGLIVVIFMITINSFRVSEISFSGDYPVNDEIEVYIESQNKHMLFFDFHKNNYQDLAKELRGVFSEYEWISIEKKGSIIYVDVEPTTTKKITEEENVFGDIVAKKSGIISEYKIFGGSTTIKMNNYVKAGEVLIAGGASKAKGFVLATVYEEHTVVVNKEEIVTDFSGKSIKYNQISLFKKVFNINKREEYINSDIKTKTIFSIPFLFSINKIEEYEKNDIIFTYDKKTATNYAIKLIEDNFNQNKVLNEERILRIEAITTTETTDGFEIKLLVKKIESIGEFKSRV